MEKYKILRNSVGCSVCGSPGPNADQNLYGTSAWSSQFVYSLNFGGFAFSRELNGEELYCSYTAPEQECNHLMELIKGWSQGILITVVGELKTISNDDGSVIRRSIIVNKIKSIKNSVKLKGKMKELIEQEKIPKIINVFQFGNFTLDKSINMYEGKGKLLGQLVGITIENKQCINLLKKVFNKEFINEAREYAINELLDLANEWQEQSEDFSNKTKPITKEILRKYLKCEYISVDEKKDVSIQFSDNIDNNFIFGGHSPLVYWSEINGFISAEI